MKTIAGILVSIICSINLFGQSKEDGLYHHARTVFNSNVYKKRSYPKFDGEIKTSGTGYYQIGDRILKVSKQDVILNEIVRTGVFNPDVVFGKMTTGKSQISVDSLPTNTRILYNLTRNDSLSICCLEELKELNPNPQIRRFTFWVFRKGMLNPIEYYLELQNSKANRLTGLKDFVEHATMTFYYKATIII